MFDFTSYPLKCCPQLVALLLAMMPALGIFLLLFLLVPCSISLVSARLYYSAYNLSASNLQLSDILTGDTQQVHLTGSGYEYWCKGNCNNSKQGVDTLPGTVLMVRALLIRHLKFLFSSAIGRRYRC